MHRQAPIRTTISRVSPPKKMRINLVNERHQDVTESKNTFDAGLPQLDDETDS